MATSSTVPLMGSELTWASVVGLFLLNFGHLEFLVSDLLARRLEPTEFEKARTLHFGDRVARLKALSATDAEEQAFADFERALKPVRELRNHIAHGYFSITLRPDSKEPMLGITQARDLYVCFSETTYVVSFDDLLQHLAALSDVIERLTQLASESSGRAD